MSDSVIHTLGHGFDWCAPSIQWPVTTDVGPGLTGVIAAATRVMWLDPSSGHLAYRGVPIEVLAHRPDFERTAYLLITGQTADEGPQGFVDFRRNLRCSRGLPKDVLDLIATFQPSVHPTRILRAGISTVGCHELTVDDDIEGRSQWSELRIVGQVASLVCQIVDQRRGHTTSPVAGPEISLGDGVLRALVRRDPSDEERRALNLLWVLYAVHGLDAPTFTSMIVASCLADPYYNVVAGLSALTGRHQGGAGEHIIERLLALEDPDAATRWVDSTVARGGVIPGFGHRAYRMADPRAVVLRKAAASLARQQGQGQLYEVTRAVEEAATLALAPRGIFVNINLYGALVFHLLGAEPAEIPCLIAVARTAGMVALVRETLHDIRLYRPLSRYVGPTERPFPAGRNG